MESTLRSEGIDIRDRVRGALLGLLIGDTLAMPVHWYYNRVVLQEDYGTVRDFVEPNPVHPDSIFWRSRWQAPRPELDILGDQRRFWGQRGIHYHRNLSAGDNTLTAKLATEVWESLHQRGGYDRDDYLKRYVELLTHPERHGDTYIEECHRGFFSNLGRGRKPDKCAVLEKHISGLVMMLPVALFYAHDEEEGRARAVEHLAATHAGDKMRIAAEAILSILYPVLHGDSLAEAIRSQCTKQHNPHFGFPFSKWVDQPDEKIIGSQLSTACYVEDSVPAVIYLALKYGDRPEQGLIANTNLGGDNVHRGGVLGALLGAQGGVRGWPERWVSGLLETREAMLAPQLRATVKLSSSYSGAMQDPTVAPRRNN